MSEMLGTVEATVAGAKATIEVGRFPIGEGGRPKWRNARVHIWIEGESIFENLLNRFARPHQMYRDEILPVALRLLGLEGVKASWSQKAGCRCGCSPGFILQKLSEFDFSVKVKFEEKPKDDPRTTDPEWTDEVTQLRAERLLADPTLPFGKQMMVRETMAPALSFTGWCYQPPQNHDKTWQVVVQPTADGAVMARRWGRRNAEQSGMQEKFSTLDAAIAAAQKLIDSKLRKGYRRMSDPSRCGLDELTVVG